VKSIDDIKGQKVRVQATKTEDTLFPAYGAQTVHMPFGEVYTSLQTGVVNIAENGVNVYMANKHYEVAPILSMTEHEANNNCIWVSDKLWNSLSDQEKGWVQAAADEVAKKEPALGLKLETDSADKLKTMGVKVVDGVDKSGFIKAAAPIQDQLAKELGPHAVKILEPADHLGRRPGDGHFRHPEFHERHGQLSRAFSHSACELHGQRADRWRADRAVLRRATGQRLESRFRRTGRSGRFRGNCEMS